MAKLIVHNPPTVKLKASGYTGTPTGDIELTENNRTYNVSPFATATTAIPEEEKTVTPSTVEQVITPDEGLLKKVTVNPTPLEEKTVTPTTEQQTIVPQSPAIGLSRVIVEPTAPPPVLIEKTITENGTYTAEDDNADGYSDVTVEVPVPVPVTEKAVNFYDYDGTLLYSYTVEESAELIELPPLPIVEGYTYYEWNWTLSEIKKIAMPVDVMAMSYPADGATILKYNFYKGEQLNPSFSINVNGTVAIDWGDDTSDIYTSNTTAAHIYSSFGKYTVRIIPKNNNALSLPMRFLKSCQTSLEEVRFGSVNQDFLPLYSLSNCYRLKAVSFSKSFTRFMTDSLSSCVSLKAIGLPNGAQQFKGNVLKYNRCLSIVSFPYSFESLGDDSVRELTTLKKITINPLISIGMNALSDNLCLSYIYLAEGLAQISSYMFNNNRSLQSITIPSSVVQINSFAFLNCTSLYTLDLSKFDDPTLIPTLDSTNALQGTPADQIISVKNQEMLEAFSAATNWSTYADKFQIKGATP